ncbi:MULTISPECIES: MFS transporter [Actinoplanes]|uniref:MFS transporter n=1 Tax=Actinoplanes TaxID=1865 RepID=UPI0005F2C5ED|nr:MULTISPECIES: MFS transporter [Actinoplanes]GLY00467.1 MFS transporter [Actinoplanes sp. NBRC 101535]
MTDSEVAAVPTVDADRRTVDRARWAITLVFFVNGLLISTYLVRIPSLKASLGLGETTLGVVLTCYGVAALGSMQSVGPLVARFGSRNVVRVTLAALPFALAGIGVAGDARQLAVAVAVAGGVHGTLDVAMNAHAVAVEKRRGRPILNGCHAAWSISAILSSLLGAAVIRAGIPVFDHMLWVAVVLFAAGLPLTLWLLPASADRAAPASGDGGGPARPGWRTGWTRTVAVFGAIGLVLMLCEAAVISWSGVFLHEDRGASLAVAAFGYGAFTLFQTLGRLTGDRLTERFGRTAVFRAYASIAALGFGIVLVGDSPAPALAGFAVLGYGTSVLVPLIFSAAGQAGGEGAGAATFVSRITTFTYAGILMGPAAVGWLGQAFGLSWTFAGLIPFMLAAVLLAGVMRSVDRPAAVTG